MAGAGKKTFTAGEILTASDTNTYLMEQTVMNFAGTAARASAIPTPSTGMTTYIGTTGTASIPQIETYTGSAWQTPYGMTLVANVSFTTASAIAVDNVFTSAYENYRVVITATGSANVGSVFNFRKATVANGFGFYGAGFYTQFSGGSANFNSANNTLTCSVAGFGTGGGTSVFDVINARQTTGNSAFLQGQFHYQPGGYNAFFGYNIGADTFDGFAFTPASGTFTGKIKVYGYRNS